MARARPKRKLTPKAGRHFVALLPDVHAEGDGTDNRSLAELCSQAAARSEGHLARAFRRAARAALLWPIEARDLLEEGRSLQELPAIGPYLGRVLRTWIEEPPERETLPVKRTGFLSLTQARRVLARSSRQADSWADLQVHSTWSDGRADPADMVKAAHALGRSYIAFTDHTRGLAIANGMDESRLEAQGRILRSLDAEWADRGIRVLRSAETNLTPEGVVDMPATALQGLDLVLGAFHSQLRRTEDQTHRYLLALRNPSIDVLAHPRCRVYDHRLGLTADWRHVADEAARLGKALEIDAHPDRQDLDVATLEHVRAAGCHVSMGSDAHSERELGSLELAVAAAVLARIPERLWINTWPAEKLLDWSRTRRSLRTESARVR